MLTLVVIFPPRLEKVYRQLKRPTISLPSTLSQSHRMGMINKERRQQMLIKMRERKLKSPVVLMLMRRIKTELNTR